MNDNEIPTDGCSYSFWDVKNYRNCYQDECTLIVYILTLSYYERIEKWRIVQAWRAARRIVHREVQAAAPTIHTNHNLLLSPPRRLCSCLLLSKELLKNYERLFIKKYFGKETIAFLEGPGTPMEENTTNFRARLFLNRVAPTDSCSKPISRTATKCHMLCSRFYNVT